MDFLLLCFLLSQFLFGGFKNVFISFVGIFVVVFLILTIIAIILKEYVISFLFSILFILWSYIIFDYTTDYLQKSSPKVVYQTDSYKVLEYKCDEKSMVKVLENDNDRFYIPESLLIVRCTDEIERK